MLPSVAVQEFKIKNIRFACEIEGAGAETFVLIHGWCSVRNFWAPVINDFAAMGRTINLDLVGHHPANRAHEIGEFDLIKLTLLQAQAIKEIVGKKKVTIVGHSTGGLIALALGLYHPEIVRRVIAIGPVVHGPIKGPLGFAKDLYKLNFHAPLHLPFLFIRSLPDAFKNIFETGLHDPKVFFRRRDAEGYVVRYREQMLGIQPEIMGAWLEAIDTADLRPALTGNALRALFITGSHDRVVDHTQARLIARAMPNAAYHEYARSGHIPILEEEAECFHNMSVWLKNAN